MEERRNVPRLRFPGFTDDWEQRKFGDVGSVSMCKRIFKDETSTEGEIPFYKIGTFGGKPDAFISRGLFEEYKSKFSYPKKGDILLSASGTIGRIVEYNGEEAYFQDSNIVWLSHGETVENKFLKALYPIVEWAGIEGSTIKRLYNDNFLKTEFMMPSVGEQEKIGAFFECLDNLITLHQRKLDSMKQYKQGMLQKMFPKEGEKTPKIRFPGFTTNWDSVCLGDLYKERNERGNDNLPILSVSIHTGVSGGELDTEELGKNVRRSEDKSLYKRVYSGDLVFNMMRAWQGAIGVVKNEGMVSPAYISAVPNERVYPSFMDYLLRRNEVINQINNLSYGVTDFRKRLYWDSFVQVGVCLPSLEEQMMITALFQEMDSYLSVNQKKVNQMLQYKQGLLQQMFV